MLRPTSREAFRPLRTRIFCSPGAPNHSEPLFAGNNRSASPFYIQRGNMYRNGR
jgi:hypothetical protein